jgi:hypothetical protein
MPADATPRTFESYEEAGAWLRASFGAWADELSEAEYEAVRYYTSPAYEALNLALRLRQPLSPDQERHVAALDGALRVPLPEPVTAYRGLEFGQPVDLAGREGSQLVFRAYVSTSLLRSVAEGFCALAPTKDHAVLFETLLPAGTLVGCPDLIQPTLEAELLLPRLQPLTMGSALPPASGHRYWTVQLQAATRSLHGQQGVSAPARVRQQVVTGRSATGLVPPSSSTMPRFAPPRRGPSIGR